MSVVFCQQVYCCVFKFPFRRGQLTSIKISLWSKTPRRMFARVMPHMMIKAPIMKPWDHASRVSFPGSVGFCCSATAVVTISTACACDALRVAVARGCESAEQSARQLLAHLQTLTSRSQARPGGGGLYGWQRHRIMHAAEREHQDIQSGGWPDATDCVPNEVKLVACLASRTTLNWCSCAFFHLKRTGEAWDQRLQSLRVAMIDQMRASPSDPFALHIGQAR